MLAPKSLIGLVCLACAVLASASPARAQDWPTWRYDANRSGATPESLASELHLQWVRDLPAPRPAFPGEVRLRFDAGAEPVVLGKTMFVPSMVTDTVTALNTETGEVRWRFFTDGPVRFAPLASDGKVYVTSDDGFLTCLSAESGKLLWKFRGLPDKLKDRKLLGNGRLISLWPARGGAVLSDGILYFAAGIWPDDGVYIHALDAASGKPVWANSNSNRIPKANMDHGVAQYAGLTPQGYLAIVGEKLVVPCGAQLAAFLDLKTGTLHDYTMGWGGRVGLPKGSWFVAGAGKYLSHSGDLYDVTRPNDEKFQKPSRRGDFKTMLYPGGFTRLLIDPTNQRALGAVRQPMMTPEAMYYNDRQTGIVAYDLRDVKLKDRKKLVSTRFRENDRYPDRWKGDLQLLWSMPSKHEVHLKAGRRLYLGGSGAVQAVDIPEEGAEPVVSWNARIEGTPHRMLAAAGKLFVVTLDGRIYAFGDQARDPLARHALLKPDAPAEDEWTALAKEILKETKATEGYALVLGLRDGRLVEELVRQSNLTVIAVDPDAIRVARLREKLDRAGVYGTRATAHEGDPLAYPFPPYLADLIVSEHEDSGFTESRETGFAAAVFRPLRPYGGTACFRISPDKLESLEKLLSGARLPCSSVRRAGSFVLLSRQGALPTAADWSHSDGDAANSGASQDRFLRAPLGLLWFDGSIRWQRQPGRAEVRVAEGRVIIKADRLHAIDAYTGRHLWQRALPAAGIKRDEMVATKDGITFAAGESCVVLDPADGKKIAEIRIPEGTSGRWSNLRVWQDYLVGTVGKHLVCIERRSGKTAWTYECARAALSTAVGRGRVFCAERINERRGETAEKANLKTRAFRIGTGEVLWEITSGDEVRYSEAHDLLVAASGVYRGADGGRIQDGMKEVQIAGEHLIRGTSDSFRVYDLLTGDRKGEELKWYRRGCTGLRTSCNLVTTRFKANAAYVDIETREITSLWNIRSGCNNNLFPANGILNVPNVTGGCECNYTPTSKAFVPLAEIEPGGSPR